VPELQGEPEDVAKEKCIMATKQVCKYQMWNQIEAIKFDIVIVSMYTAVNIV